LSKPSTEKWPDHLVDGHDLAVAAGRPAEQREEIVHGRGQDAEVSIVANRHRAVPLAQLLAIRPVDHGQVREHRDPRA
jgi:hypothetical protein